MTRSDRKIFVGDLVCFVIGGEEIFLILSFGYPKNYEIFFGKSKDYNPDNFVTVLSNSGKDLYTFRTVDIKSIF